MGMDNNMKITEIKRGRDQESVGDVSKQAKEQKKTSSDIEEGIISNDESFTEIGKKCNKFSK